jgi:hypothetical protein
MSSSPLFDMSKAKPINASLFDMSKAKPIQADPLVTGEGMMKPAPIPTPPGLAKDQTYFGSKGPSPLETSVAEFKQGNIARGVHGLATSYGQALSPLALPAAVASPLPFLAALGGGLGGQYLAKKGGAAIGLSPDQQELAGDIGGIGGGIAGGATGGALRVPWIRGAARSVLLDPVTGEPTTTPGSFLKRILRTPEEAEGIASTAKGPNIPITESPNYPAIAAARGAAMKSARAEIPSGQSVSLAKSPYAAQNKIAKSPKGITMIADMPQQQAAIPQIGAPTPGQELATRQAAMVPTEGGPTGSAQQPFEPLVYASPEEEAQIRFRMENLKRQASAAGTYHAAQGATGKKLNLQQRIAKKSLPWMPDE